MHARSSSVPSPRCRASGTMCRHASNGTLGSSGAAEKVAADVGIDTVIAVVSGAEKPLAILGVLRAHVIDVLVVDEGNARAVLDFATESAGDRSTRERTPNIVAMS